MKNKVYTDCIVGWEECYIVDVNKIGRNLGRALVLTETGTLLNRICKYVENEDEIEADGCVYFIEKQ